MTNPKKVAVVTGGSGKAIATGLAHGGWFE